MLYCVLSIIIVNYNTRELLEKCLGSLFKYCSQELENQEYEIIVVDNGSDKIQNSKFKIQNYGKFIQNKDNLGFARANNQGIKIAGGDYVLLLNSDTEVKEGTIQGMLRFIGDGGVKGNLGKNMGVVTCRILLENGKMDPACHRGFPTPWNAFCYFTGLEKLFPKIKLFSGYHQYYKDLKLIHEVDAISGAFFMIRRNVIHRVGLLDEDYFMYGEDLDWCYRVKQSGFSIWYNPQFEIIHYKKQSGREAQSSTLQKQTQKYFWLTMRIFYEKHYLKKYPGIINFTVLNLLKLFG